MESLSVILGIDLCSRMQIWRVIINKELWDQVQYEGKFYTHPEERRFAQSKGWARMRNVPQKGDIVLFVIDGVIRMSGIVESEGFLYGNDHQRSPYNTGESRRHAENPEFAWVNINKIGLHQKIRKTGQRTWTKFNSSMLL
jgi:hypothetical protein